MNDRVVLDNEIKIQDDYKIIELTSENNSEINKRTKKYAMFSSGVKSQCIEMVKFQSYTNSS
jgi:hypothetical protein